MDQKKTGAFLKRLRNEKGITQEAFAEKMHVTGRTVSRWETGSNLPDISLLVDIAEFYDVDVREIIEGGRKSEMNEEVKDVATKMVDYVGNEKRNLTKWLQVVGFAGIFLLGAAILLQKIINSRVPLYEGMSPLDKAALVASCIAFVFMVVITSYVIEAFEKKGHELTVAVEIKRLVIIAACFAVLFIVLDKRFNNNIYNIKDGWKFDRVEVLDGYYVGVSNRKVFYTNEEDRKFHYEKINPAIDYVWQHDETDSISVFVKKGLFLRRQEFAHYYITDILNTEQLGSMQVIRTPSGKVFYCYGRDSYLAEPEKRSEHIYEENLYFSYDGKKIELNGDYWFESDVDFTTGGKVLYFMDIPCKFICIEECKLDTNGLVTLK